METTTQGGRPRGGPHIENVTYWDKTEGELRFIISDATAAMKANAASGEWGKWADQVNDAATVLSWGNKPRSEEPLCYWRFGHKKERTP